MRDLISVFFKLFVFFVIFFAIVITNTMQHESVHQAIYQDYGIKSKIEYYWFKGALNGILGETVALNNAENCKESCMLAHEYNEIIGYNVNSLILSLFGVAGFWLIITETRRIEDDTN